MRQEELGEYTMIKRVKPFYKEGWINGIQEYLSTYDFWHDGIIEEFERKVADYVGRKYGITTNSTTNSIFMCLYVWSKVYPDKKEVIISNWGYPASFRSCDVLGLTPVPVDINPHTLSITETNILEVLNSNTLAVIYPENNGIIGYPQYIKEEIGDDVLFIEDAAPSMAQKNAGTYGDVGIFSFSPTKPLMAGEGSCIVTDSKFLDATLKTFRYQNDFTSKLTSLNFNLSPFLAAFLMPQFEYLDDIKKMRERIHNEYKKHLNIFEEETNRHGSIMFIHPKAKDIYKKLKTYGIESRYKYYTCYNDSYIDFPVSCNVKENIIDLPMHHELTYDQIGYICSIVKREINE